jgi:hypothetical protein
MRNGMEKILLQAPPLTTSLTHSLPALLSVAAVALLSVPVQSAKAAGKGRPGSGSKGSIFSGGAVWSSFGPF